MSIRLASVKDAKEILEIYAPYIKETVVTFEYQVPSLEDFCHRMERIQAKYPWLVWEEDGVLLGYAYAGDFAVRTAFSWSCELSVYLRMDARGKGIGRRLYEALMALLKEMGYCNVYALICVPNAASESLHRSLGFVEEGRLQRIGYKFERWLDLSYQSKCLQENPGNPDAFPKRFLELPAERVQELLNCSCGRGREEKER